MERKRIKDAVVVSFKKRPWTNFLEWLKDNFRTWKSALTFTRTGEGVFLVSVDGRTIVYMDIRACTITGFLQESGLSVQSEFVMDWYRASEPWTRDRFIQAAALKGIKYIRLDEFAGVLFGVAEPSSKEPADKVKLAS